MQATEADVRVSTGQQPETRPGLHVTSEGRLVGHAEINMEWYGTDDVRTSVSGVDHEERTMYVSKQAHEDLRKEAAFDAAAGAPSPPQHPTLASTMPTVSTTVTDEGKETVESNLNVNVESVEDMEDVLDAVAERMGREARQRLKREGTHE